MESLDNIRSRLREFRKYAAELSSQISQIDAQIASYEQFYYSIDSSGETSVEQLSMIRQQILYYAAEKSRIEAERQGINAQVMNDRNVVQEMLISKSQNISILQGLPQFGSVSSDMFKNIEINSANECNIVLSEIDAFLQGDYSDDGTVTYGQKKI